MLELKTSEDCKKLVGLTHEEVKVVGSVKMPDMLYLNGLKNVKITGGTLTGFMPFFIDSEDVTLKGIGIRSSRPAKVEGLPNPLDPSRYEKWWGPRIWSTKEFGCRNFTIDSCSISGNLDEWAIHPDLTGWDVTKFGGENLTIKNCLVGPSLINKSRGNHNFGLSINLWKNVLLEKNVFYSHNRRCPQVQGDVTIIGLAIYGYGSMGLGLHCGTSAVLRDIYGRHNRLLGQGTNKLVTAVGGTLSSEFSKLGGISIDFSNVVDYTRGWKDRQSIDMTDKISGRPVPTTFKNSTKPPKYTESQILNGIGCGDNFDKWILNRISKGDFKWISEI